MSVNLNLKNLPIADLEALQASVTEELKRAKANRAAAVRRRLEDVAHSEGFSIKDLFPIARRRTPRHTDVRAINPQNPSQTWSGRGRRPGWLTPELLERAKPHHSVGQN